MLPDLRTTEGRLNVSDPAPVIVSPLQTGDTQNSELIQLLDVVRTDSQPAVLLQTGHTQSWISIFHPGVSVHCATRRGGSLILHGAFRYILA